LGAAEIFDAGGHVESAELIFTFLNLANAPKNR